MQSPKTQDAASDATARAPDGRGSAIASELRKLSVTQLNHLGIADKYVRFLDLLLQVTNALRSPTDTRPWPERLNQVLSDPAREVDLVDLASDLEEVSDSWIQDNIEGLFAEGKLKFYNRMLGTARYNRLREAFARDAETILEATRVGLEQVRPLLVALEDALGIVDPLEIEDPGLKGISSGTLLGGIVEVDELLGVVLDVIRARTYDFSVLNAERSVAFNVVAIATELRLGIEIDTDDRLAQVNSILERKMQGARDAMRHSADGPSQAANSLVEVLDRLLRHVVPIDAELLDWVDGGYPGDRGDLTYVPNGSSRVRPTKRAQILHFVYAGRTPASTEPLTEALALAFLRARAALQAIKHADDNQAEAAENIEAAMRALTGAFTVALRLRFVTSPVSGQIAPDDVEQILAS